MRTCAPSRQTELTNKLRCLGNISVLPTRSGFQLLLHGVFAAKYAILCKTHVQMLITIILCRLSAWFHWANCGNAWNRNGNMNCFATKCFVWSCDLLRIRKGSEVTMNSVAVMCFGIRFGWCSKRLRHHWNQSDRRNSFYLNCFGLNAVSNLLKSLNLVVIWDFLEIEFPIDLPYVFAATRDSSPGRRGAWTVQDMMHEIQH